MVSIDPGVRASGQAFWEGKKLVYVAYDAPSGPSDYSPLIIEKPQVYQGRAQKGNPNDLIDLAVEVGRIIGISEVAFETVLPRQWKGAVKKEIMLKRILSKLDDDELLVIKNCGVSNSKAHNIIDAVGIGLWKLGRL